MKMRLLMLQMNIFFQMLLFFPGLVFSEELFIFEDTVKTLNAIYLSTKYDICNSVKYEREIKDANKDYVSLTLVELKDTYTQDKPDHTVTQIRKPTSVAIQDEHEYRDSYRTDFQERADNLLIVLNKNKSISAKQLKDLKSKIAELESQLRQGEEKLCSKSEEIVH